MTSFIIIVLVGYSIVVTALWRQSGATIQFWKKSYQEQLDKELEVYKSGLERGAEIQAIVAGAYRQQRNVYNSRGSN